MTVGKVLHKYETPTGEIRAIKNAVVGYWYEEKWLITYSYDEDTEYEWRWEWCLDLNATIMPHLIKRYVCKKD